MIPVKLKLSNFTSYGESPPELDFTPFKLAAISGLNGAGKSSLLDAISWCVWGSSRAGEGADELVHSGANEMQVEFSFELDSHLYTIKRRRVKKGGGSTALELWSGSTSSPLHNLTEGTIKSTQEKIINTLHLTFEAFTNSSYLRQGHADEFTTKGPTDRKRILADILGLSGYDKLEEKAKEKVKQTENDLKLREYQLLEIEAELSQKEEKEKALAVSQQKVLAVENDIKNMETQLKLLLKEKETLLLASEQRNKLEQNLSQQEEELVEIIKQGKERAERIKNLESRVKSQEEIEQKITESKKSQTELEDLRKKDQEKLKLQNELSTLQGELNVKLEQKKALQNGIDKLQEELKKLSLPSAKCPTCGQEIGKEKKHKVIDYLQFKIKEEEEKLSKINTTDEQLKIKEMEKTLSFLAVDSSKLIALENSLKELENLQKQKEQVLQNQASLETEKKTRQELLTLYENKNLQIKKLQQDLQKLPQLSQDLSSLLQTVSAKEQSLENLRKEEKEAQGILGQAKELISRAQQLEKLGKQKQEEKEKLEKEKEIFEELSLAFGKKGIQAMIIEAAIPEIEDEANSLLDKLTEGRMKISLQTQRETKTKLAGGEKGIVETLDIIISDEMGERAYEMYSGGEAFRVNFAIRLAISKLLTHRVGARLQFLVIDEGFGSQDAPGRARLVESIDAIKDDFEKILIITHLEELKEEFPVRIEVSKNSSGSTFEVVGI